MQDDCLNWIGQRLEDLRELKGVSAREMSRSINKEETYIRQIETKKITPSIAVLIEICLYLGITLKDFFDDEIKTPGVYSDIVEGLKKLGVAELAHIKGIVDALNKNK